MLVSMAAGRTVGMLIRFVVGTQNKGVWGQDLVAALKGIGLDTASLIRHQEPGVGHGSLAVTLDDDLAGRLAHLRSGYHGQPSFHRFRHRRATHPSAIWKQLWGLGAFHQCPSDVPFRA